MRSNQEQNISIRHCKYAHLLSSNDLFFNRCIITLFNDNPDFFDKNEHVFVTVYGNVLNEFNHYGNIILYQNSPNLNSDMINHFAEHCDWLFLHGLCPNKELGKIEKKYLPKILWRTWGHDVGVIYRKGEPLKNIAKYFFEKCSVEPIIRQFRAIGICNTVDAVNLRRYYKSIPLFVMPYTVKIDMSIAEEIRDGTPKDKKDTYHIMVGHSGFKNDNHFEMIDLLCKYRNEDVKFYFMLTYGEPEYINKVTEYAREKLGEKAIIVRDGMPYTEFLRFVGKMDAAVLDGKKSYALGNIQILVYLRKKIFLNSNGIVASAFTMEKIPFESTREIGNLSFDELKQCLHYEDKNAESLSLQTYEYTLQKWRAVLESLTM